MVEVCMGQHDDESIPGAVLHSRSPWKRPASTKIWARPVRMRNLLLVTVPAAAWKVSVAADPFGTGSAGATEARFRRSDPLVRDG